MFVMWIGTNDLGMFAYLSNDQIAGKFLPDFTECIFRAFDKLYAGGTPPSSPISANRETRRPQAGHVALCSPTLCVRFAASSNYMFLLLVSNAK